jgi:hypothetical protein
LHYAIIRWRSSIAADHASPREVSTALFNRAQYARAVGRETGAGKLAADWRVILPEALIDRRFEGQ